MDWRDGGKPPIRCSPSFRPAADWVVRWLFLIEGIITFSIGLWAFFYLPAGPTQTAGGIRGKGWFTEREEVIIVNKVLRDDPTKSDSESCIPSYSKGAHCHRLAVHNREGLSLRDLLNSLYDYDLWPIYAVSTGDDPT
jgi:hypothetical protein